MKKLLFILFTFCVTANAYITPLYSVPSGPAGGDLSGTYPNPSVVKLQGISISSASPSDSQVLTYNGTSSQWEPRNSGSGGSAYVNGGNTFGGDATIGLNDGFKLSFLSGGLPITSIGAVSFAGSNGFEVYNTGTSHTRIHLTNNDSSKTWGLVVGNNANGGVFALTREGGGHVFNVNPANQFFGLGLSQFTVPTERLMLKDGNIAWASDGGGDIGLSSNERPNNIYAKSSVHTPVLNLWTLPVADGSAGQVLTTNGSAALSWTTVSSSGIESHGTAASPISIVPGTGIVPTSSNDQVWWVQPSTGSGAVPITATPPIAAGSTVGQRLTLKSVSSSSYLVIPDVSGVDLNGPVDFGPSAQSIEFMWDGTNWSENGRRI